MPRFLWSPFLTFLILVPDVCFTSSMSSKSRDDGVASRILKTSSSFEKRNHPFSEFHNNPSPAAPGRPSEVGLISEGALRQFLRAVTSVLPERFHKQQRTFLKHHSPPKVFNKSHTSDELLASKYSPTEGPLAKLLDEYPKDKASVYLENLGPLAKLIKYPKLQESAEWKKSDQSEKSEIGELLLTENKSQKEPYKKVWGTASRYLVKLNPPTSSETKRAMKERCRSTRKEEDGNTICFTYPKNVSYYPVYYYAYPAYYYPYYYPYYYWGRR